LVTPATDGCIVVLEEGNKVPYEGTASLVDQGTHLLELKVQHLKYGIRRRMALEEDIPLLEDPVILG